MLLFVGASLRFLTMAFAGNSVTSDLTATAVPGAVVKVIESVNTDQSGGVYSVEESIPFNWTVSSISHAGRFDPATQRVKWGPFFDHYPRLLSFSMLVPQTAAGDYVFVGDASFDGTSQGIQGNRNLHLLTAGEANVLIRTLPASFQPGIPLPVSIDVLPRTNLTVYAIEETIPSGWSLTTNSSTITQGGIYDPYAHKIKWGPYYDHSHRILAYQVVPPSTYSPSNRFSGRGSFDLATIPILGSSLIQPGAGVISRSLSANFQPGRPLPVSLRVIPLNSTVNYAMEDRLPDGWTASAISSNGQFDPFTGSVKWGPFFDANSRIVSYQAIPPSGSQGQAQFLGRASFDTVVVPTGGNDTTLAIADSILRVLPSTALPGSSIPISWMVAPEAQTRIYAVEDQLPPGWTADNVVTDRNEAGVFDAFSAKVKWGPFLDGIPRILSATVRIPLNAGTNTTFYGIGSFDQRLATMGGARDLQLLPNAGFSQVTRFIPASIHGGGLLTLNDSASPSPNITAYAVEEVVPSGWLVVSISNGGVFDEFTGKIKWGPFFDSSSRNLTADLRVPQSFLEGAVFGGRAVFNSTGIPITGASNMTIVPNLSPVARDDTEQRAVGQPAVIPVSSLLSNDTDPNGDALSVIGIQVLTERGAAVSLTNGAVVYDPPAALHGPDTFTYTIGDGFGGIASAVVTIDEMANGPSQNVKSISTTTGAISLIFGGVPGLTYRIQAATAINPPDWVNIGIQTASPIGEISFNDPGFSSHPNRYYRTIFP